MGLRIKGDRAREKAGLALFAHAVGVALDVEDGGAVEEAVQGGGGHDGVACEDVATIGEGLVGGDDGGEMLFVADADHLEEERGLLGVEAEVADLVDLCGAPHKSTTWG